MAKSMYAKEIMELAQEIAQHLGSTLEEDIDFVADWLVNGGDDGSSAAELTMSFDSQHALPSKDQP